MAEEVVTGNSLFKKLDVEGLSEAIGAGLGAMAYGMRSGVRVANDFEEESWADLYRELQLVY